ncbi:MAG: hypothetical protein R3C16_09200 [Hyphomonadaceae bacterium]
MKALFFVSLATAALFGAAHPVLAQGPVPDTVRSSGLTQAQEQELNRRLRLLQGQLRALASETALREGAVRNIAVEIFGARPDLDFETYAALINSGARELRAYITQARTRAEADPVLADLRARAITAAEAGRLTEARGLYDQLIAHSTESLEARWAREDREREQERDAQRLAVATDMAEAARLAFAAADYRDAATRYARAVEGAPESAREERWEWRIEQGLALYEQGDRFETAALVEAQQVFEREALPLVPRATDAQRWAQTQINLGGALLMLGERQGGPEGLATLTASRAAFESALEVQTRADDADGWASTQMKLGNVLLLLGVRQEDTIEVLVTLLAARAAFESALEVKTPAADALGWAAMQVNLGIVLGLLGEHQDGPERLAALAASRAAYERALAVQTRNGDAQGWAMTQTQLGDTLLALGQHQGGPEGLATLAASRAAYERALEVRTRQTDPLGWALTQRNLGNSLLLLGQRQGGPEGLATLAAARAAFERALEVSTRAADAQGWAVMQANLGFIEEIIGDLDGGLAAYERAVSHARAALEVFDSGEYRRIVASNLARAERKRDAAN